MSRLVPVEATEIELRKLSLYIPFALSHMTHWASQSSFNLEDKSNHMNICSPIHHRNCIRSEDKIRLFHINQKQDKPIENNGYLIDMNQLNINSRSF
jgi:hypothetical protein